MTKASTRRMPGGAPSRFRLPDWDSLLVTAVFLALTAGLVFAAASGTTGMYVAGAVAVYLVILSALGRERTAILTLMGAFATAPAYKGMSPSLESPVTATDGLFLVGFALLLPAVARGHLRLPLTYLVGLVTVFVTGCIASAISAETLESFLALTLWLMVMGGLPIMFALWRPPSKIVMLLAWSYVAGQIANTAYALVDGPWVQERYAGLSQHPNWFGQSGMMAIALLIYLFWRHQDTWARIVVLGAAGICGASVLLSGSRAATVVVAVLVLMIPIVERSAIAGFLYALVGALAIVALPLAVGIAGEQSSLARLAGNSNSALSDEARNEGLQDGLDRFWANPLTGDGLIDLFEIHNNFLEVAVGIGIIGLVGYLFILFAFARPLFGNGEHRRLAYTMWAYIGFGATIPSLYDRSIWGPVALSTIAVVTAATTRPAPLAGHARPTTTPAPAASA